MRYERKYRVEQARIAGIRSQIEMHPLSFRKEFPDRQVNNIYLDTPERECLQDNLMGVAQREKWRVRWYGIPGREIDRPVLERKWKNGEVGGKDSLKMQPFVLQSYPALRDELHQQLMDQVRNLESDLGDLPAVEEVSDWRDYFPERRDLGGAGLFRSRKQLNKLSSGKSQTNPATKGDQTAAGPGSEQSAVGPDSDQTAIGPGSEEAASGPGNTSGKPLLEVDSAHSAKPSLIAKAPGAPAAHHLAGLPLARLQPVLINTYRRSYYRSFDRQFRLTLDWDMRFQAIDAHFNGLSFMMRDEAVVIEVKYDREGDEAYDRVGQFLPYRLGKNSKYVNGMLMVGKV